MHLSGLSLLKFYRVFFFFGGFLFLGFFSWLTFSQFKNEYGEFLLRHSGNKFNYYL